MQRITITAWGVIALSQLLTLQAVGQGGFPLPATTVQLPTFGVSIDAGGVLALKSFRDPGGRLARERRLAARRTLPEELHRPSPCRKVSLTRLDAALQKQLASGKPPTADMRYLAGLLRLEYAFLFLDHKEIVLAGPAEGWLETPSGHAIGITTGRPVLELQDLAVALRAYPPGTRSRPFVGCTINPDREGLVRLQKFQATIPRVIPASQRGPVAVRIARGMRDSLGLAHIRVFGISAKTQFAQNLVEADYRMKLMAVGLERPPVRMQTFLGELRRPRGGGLQRWWFTPLYDCLRVDQNRLAIQLVGQAVQLQTEDKVVRPDGVVVDSGRPPSAACQAYASSFTRRYPQIAARLPVYAKLRNHIDMLVMAAFLQDERWYNRADSAPQTLLDEKQLAVEKGSQPQRVRCVANSVWKGSRLLAPAGGGVSISPHLALRRPLPDTGRKLYDWREHEAGRVSADKDRWWWD